MMSPMKSPVHVRPQLESLSELPAMPPIQNGSMTKIQRRRYNSLKPQGYGGYGPSSSFDDDDDDDEEMQKKRTDTKWRKLIKDAFFPEEDKINYYRDEFNDQSWSCTFGTSDENGIWINMDDQAGTIMGVLVWVLLLYSAATVLLLHHEGGVPSISTAFYCLCCAMALACHVKTSLTDPGAVPHSAVPREALLKENNQSHAMCSQCQTFKPPMSHHCRICNRCVSRMDHHCPWMNNCIGAGNMKHFVLFLCYTWLCSASAMILLGWSYFFCDDAISDCQFHFLLSELVRIMLVLSLAAFIFCSSMIMNVSYGLMTGIGTIDRLKKKAQNSMASSDEEPIPLVDVFGIGGYHTWLLPLDPIFDDFDRIMGYSTPQRLLREQLMAT